jgi:hypothetical protein
VTRVSRHTAFWAVFALAQALYLTITLWSLPRIAAEAEGLRPFDMRPLGYSVAEARAFVVALSPDGRDFYLGTQQVLDTVYPAILGLMFVLGFALLFRRRLVLLLLPVALATVVFDYLENAGVAAMLVAGPEAFNPEQAAITCRWTQLKSASTTLGYIALLAGFAGLLRGRWGRRP